MSRPARVLVWLSAFGVMGSVTQPAPAWEVGLDQREGWKSIYCSRVAGVDVELKTDEEGQRKCNTGSAHGQGQLVGNEHAEITDHMLWAIHPDLWQKLGTNACATSQGADANCPRLVDLNASWLRRDVIHPGAATCGSNCAGDLDDTTLEERRLPPLAAWSSLPDFAYTVYDWINERRLCPALPPGADRFELCHAYSGWLGAGLNSTHFGHLPMRVYGRYHEIALSLAARASALRSTLKAGNADAWHRQYVLELERLALAYEATGQHFVQDRWSSGHMIARWGPGSYEELPREDGREPELSNASMMGVFTGILHGSQAVFHHPDPLSGPLLGTEGLGDLVNLLFTGTLSDNAGEFARWRYTSQNQLSPPTQSQLGVGDFLFEPLLKKAYSGDKAGVDPVVPPLSLAGATNQLKGMVYCGAQGFRQVIAALGANDPPATSYGMLELPLPDPETAEQVQGWVPGAQQTGKNPVDDPLCNSQWVTNESWYMGVRTIAGQHTLLAGDLVVGITTYIVEDDPEYTPPALFFRIIEPYTKARLAGLEQVLRDQEFAPRGPGGRVEYGTELARNSPTMWSNDFWWHGNQNYSLPTYYEPADLDALPERDDQTGRDKDAVFGLFNKATVSYWCEQSLSANDQTTATGRLAKLRDEIVSTVGDDPKRNALTATCSYLAERLHKRTDTKYDGPRNEVIGEFLPFDELTKHGTSYEPVCKFLDPAGLVATSDANDDTRPYLLHPGYVKTPGEKGALGHAAASLERWCKKIPVLDVPLVTKDKDVVYQINDTSSRYVLLKGRNLGMKTPGGKTGQVLAQDVTGVWQPLEVWDEPTKSPAGGWSEDGELLYTRLPPFKKGFPTPATKSTPIHELVSGTIRSYYPFRLIRPEDGSASLVKYLSDGAETVGTYELEVHPQVHRIKFAPVSAGTTELRAEVCNAVWLRPNIEILAKGLYKLQNGQYTPLPNVPYTWHEDIPWAPMPGATCEPQNERAGIEIFNPDPTIFDGTAVFVFAYH